MALSARRAKFVDEYILDHNASRAARSAGYAVSGARVTAHRLLTDANVIAAIEAKKEELAKQYGLNKSHIISQLLESIELAREKMDAGSMIRAWCEIAKMLGLYAPETKRIEVVAENEVLRAKYDALSDEELMAIINGKNMVKALVMK